MTDYKKLARKVHDEYCAPGGILEQEMIRWVQDICRTRKAVDVEWVDQGFDCSSHGRQKNAPIPTNEFETMRDFLDYANGNTRATYMSGMGLMAETYEQEAMEKAGDLIRTWISRQDWYADVLEDGFVVDEFDEALMFEDADDMAFIDGFAKLQFPKLRVAA